MGWLPLRSARNVPSDKDAVTFLEGWPSSKLRQGVSQYLGEGADASVTVA